MEKKNDLTFAQEQAVYHKNSDLIISAGAGSGKTRTLIKRITTKIISGADVTKMLIVTFTKEAANELKTRLIDGLTKALNEAKLTKNKTVSSHLSSQIIKVSTADISTIDSFCYHIVKPNFDKLGLDGGFRIGNDGELNVLEKEAMNEVIDSFYEQSPIDKDFLRVIDCYSALSDEDKLSSNLLKLYHNISNTADFLETLIQPIDASGDFMDTKYALILAKTIYESITHYKRIFEDFYNEIKHDDDGIKKYGDTVNYDLKFISELEISLSNPSYKGLCNIFKSFTPVSIKNNSAPNISADFYVDNRKKFVAQIRSFCADYFSSSEEAVKRSILENQKICSSIYKVLTKFHEEYGKKKALYSICTFNDVSRYALKLLYEADGSISPVAKALRDKYDEIYIDEYQDTNSVQDKIFSTISKNNRFMVGDIKQSIYKFRYAEPEIFSYYRNTFIDKDLPCDDEKMGRSIFMSSNFRCNPEIIKLTNLLSGYMFKNSDGIPYSDKDALIFKKTDGLSPNKENCEICLIDTSKKKENPILCEGVQAEYVAKQIKKLINKGKLPNGKELKKKDIAILLRSTKSKAQPYIDALKKYGIKSSYKADISFYEKPHILLMLCILNAIDNPYNDIYLAGCMVSDIFKFSLDDLIKIRNNSSSKNAPLYSSLLEYTIDDDIKEKKDYLIKTLDSYRMSAVTMSSHNVISHIMTSSGIISMCQNEERQDLFKLYNIAREYEKSSFKGLYKFLKYIEGNIEQELREDSGDEDSVKIMTIHASKGLEFEYCFLCNLESKMQKTGEPPSLLFDRLLGVAGYISYDGDIAKYNSLIRKCVDLSNKRQEKEEEMRILYVALTRAKTKLFLTAELNDIDKTLDAFQKSAPFVSNMSVYKTLRRIDFVLGACALETDNDYFNINTIDPACVWKETIDNKQESQDDEKIIDYESILKSRFKFKYKHEYLSKIPSKLSVSRLKKNLLDLDENEDVKIDTSLASMPKFLQKNKNEPTPAEKGTATHMFLQFCDFDLISKFGYEKEKNRLVDQFFISKETADMIEDDYIKAFIEGGDGKKLIDSMLDAKQSNRLMKREFRFNFMMSAEDFSENTEIQKQNLLVQGVLDCIYENENGDIILIDYKTDEVELDNYKYVLKNRYENQLKYYKQACDKMFKKPVSKVYLYSVKLNKKVELQL